MVGRLDVRADVAHHVHVVHDVPLVLQAHYFRIHRFRSDHLDGELPPGLAGIEYVRKIYNSFHASAFLFATKSSSAPGSSGYTSFSAIGRSMPAHQNATSVFAADPGGRWQACD